MSIDSARPTRSRIRTRAWEALFALNLGFLINSMGFLGLFGNRISLLPLRTAVRIKLFLHARPTNNMDWHIAYWLPSVVVAFVVWVVLRIAAPKRVTQRFLEVPAGIATICAPAIYNLRFGWLRSPAFIEVVAVIA